MKNLNQMEPIIDIGMEELDIHSIIDICMKELDIHSIIDICVWKN